MLDYFYTEIKPLNDKLGEQINMTRTIEIEQVSRTQHVPITVMVHTGLGHYEWMKLSIALFHRNALGLALDIRVNAK